MQAVPQPHLHRFSLQHAADLGRTLRVVYQALRQTVQGWKGGVGFCDSHMKGPKSWARFEETWSAFESTLRAWMGIYQAMPGAALVSVGECERMCLSTRWDYGGDRRFGCGCVLCLEEMLKQEIGGGWCWVV